MTQKKTSVIAYIDLRKPEANFSAAIFAAEVAKATDLQLILYPKYGDNSSQSVFDRIQESVETICGQQNVSVHQKESIGIFNLFPSIHKLAAQQHAAFIVLGTDSEFLTQDTQKITENSSIPVILIPERFTFVPIKRVGIALDKERRVQKTGVAGMLAQAFAAKVQIFIQRPQSSIETKVFLNLLNYVTGKFEDNGIEFNKPEMVRKDTKFITRFCKFCAKHVDIAIMEVDPGKINDEVVTNIRTLLTVPPPQKRGDPRPIPVVLIKTGETGRATGFNG